MIAVEKHRDQGARIEEPHAGADPVTARGRRTEPVGEAQGQPSLHPARRDDDDVRSERVIGRRGEELGELLGEEVGARGTVDVERHDPAPPQTTTTGSNLEPAADMRDTCVN